MKTAVEFLENQYHFNKQLSARDFKEAKEMEKEQMRSDFWHHRRITGYEILKDKVETFKQQE